METTINREKIQTFNPYLIKLGIQLFSIEILHKFQLFMQSELIWSSKYPVVSFTKIRSDPFYYTKYTHKDQILHWYNVDRRTFCKKMATTKQIFEACQRLCLCPTIFLKAKKGLYIIIQFVKSKFAIKYHLKIGQTRENNIIKKNIECISRFSFYIIISSDLRKEFY